MFKKKSVLYTWILSYGILLLMMVVMFLLLVQGAKGQLIQEYKSITQTLQHQTNALLDTYFQDLERCAYEVCNDYMVNDFVSTSDPTGSKYHDLLPIQQSLSIYDLQSGGDVSRYLYMENIGRTLSSDAIYQTREYYALLELEGVLSQAEFADLLQGYHYNDIFAFAAGGATKALMLTSVPMLGIRPKGLLIQVMNPLTINEMIQANAAVEHSSTVLLDKDGQLLSEMGDTAVTALLREADLAAVENDEISLGGKPYWIQREPMQTLGWDLVTVVPMSSINAKSDWVIRGALPVMLIVVFATAVLCTYFVYIQYKPLNYLRKEVADSGLPAFGGNEYDQLLAAFTDARNAYGQIQSLWENQTNALRQEFVQSCIEGDAVYDEKYLRQFLSYLDVDFNGEWFGVMLLDIRGGGGSLPGGEEQRLVEGVLGRVLAAAPGGLRAYLLLRDRRWVILVNGQGEEAIAAALQRLQEETTQAVSRQAWSLVCAASKPRRDFKHIHLAYLEANELWKYQTDRAMDGGPSGIPLKAQAIQVPRLTGEQEELLLQYITAGNGEEAAAVLGLILRHNMEREDMPLSMCRCLAYDLLCGLIRSLGEIPRVWEREQGFLRADLHRLRHVNTREEISALLRETVARAAATCEGADRSMSGGRERTMDRIMQCVNDHYRDMDFNVSRAAEYLDMSMSHLSNLFKQQTGIGLLNYINGLRVKYAKQCILERHISVAQAAREAGFENINTFIRTFKKYEGVTPGNLSK